MYIVRTSVFLGLPTHSLLFLSHAKILPLISTVGACSLTWFADSAFIPLHFTELPIKNLHRGGLFLTL
jgi:hypothetical protein